MTTHRCVITIIGRMLLISATFFVSVSGIQAFGSVETASILWNAPLGLPRLATDAEKIGHKPVRREAFEAFDLSDDVHAKRKSRNGATYLDIEPSAEWRRNLRDTRKGINYVSFTLNASAGTQIDVGGAAIVVEPSSQDAKYAAIRPIGTNRSINHEMPWLSFGGARMAMLVLVTLKIDRDAGTWSMWFRDILVAADVPLVATTGNSAQMRINAGKGGAWLCGLVCSDENPLFEDDNNNTVPDDFEDRLLGKRMSSSASQQSRQILQMAWQEDKKTRPPTQFIVTTPLPDRFPELCSPQGETVHGMTGGLKIGPAVRN